MIFSCLPPQGKCEWQHLRGFVSHLNTIDGKSYTRSRCLDVENRKGEEPEVLLESPNEISVVIERKSVVWPREYLRDHGNEHCLGDIVFARLDDLFRDSAYQLAYNEVSLKGKKKREVEEIAKQITSTVLSDLTGAKSPRGIGNRKPIPWRLRPLDPRERNESTPEVGLGITVWGEIEPDYTPSEILQRQAVAKSGYAREFERAAKKAARKFVSYSDCLKLLLVQFYGSSSLLVLEEDIIDVIQSAQLPNLIDQVWVAQQDWISLDDYEIAWRRIR